MPLSPQEFERLKTQLASKSQAKLPVAKEQSLSDKIWGDLANRGKNISGIVQKGATGQKSLGSVGLQTVGQLAGGVTDLVGRGIQAITPEIVTKTATSAGEALADTELGGKVFGVGNQAIDQYGAWKQSNPEAAANLEASVNIASLIPIAKASKGVVAATGKNLAQGVQGAGSGISGAGKTIYKSSITPTVAEAERLLAFKASQGQTKIAMLGGKQVQVPTKPMTAPVTRADTALKMGISGTETKIGVKARQASQQLWQEKIAPVLEKSKEVITKDELFAPIKKRIAETVEPSRKAGLQRAYEALQEDYIDFKSAPLKQAQQIKHGLDEFTPSKMFKGQEVASEIKVLKNDMANAIRQKIYSTVDDGSVKEAYRDWGNLHELEKLGVKAISESGFKGGFGGFMSSLWDAATTPIRTVGGKVLYRVGNKVEFLGEKGVKTFGDFAKSKGVQRPLFGVDVKDAKGGLYLKNVSPQALADDFVRNTAAQLKYQGNKVLAEKVQGLNTKSITSFDDLVREASKLGKNADVDNWLQTTKPLFDQYVKGNPKTTKTTTAKDALLSQRDDVAERLHKLDSTSFVNSKGQVNIELFDEVEDLLTLIEKGKDSANDIRRAMEVLSLLKA